MINIFDNFENGGFSDFFLSIYYIYHQDQYKSLVEGLIQTLICNLKPAALIKSVDSKKLLTFMESTKNIWRKRRHAGEKGGRNLVRFFATFQK